MKKIVKAWVYNKNLKFEVAILELWPLNKMRDFPVSADITMLDDAKGSLELRIGAWLHFWIYYHPHVNGSWYSCGRGLQAAPMQGRCFGDRYLQHRANHQDTAPVHLCNGTTHQKRHGGISWRAGSFLERVPCPLLKIKFGSFLQVLWQYITTKWMLPLGPRGDQKGFCSRTIHLQFMWDSSREQKRWSWSQVSVWKLDTNKFVQIALSALKSRREISLGDRQWNAGNTTLFDRVLH